MTKSLLPLLMMFALPQVQAGATQVFGAAMPPGEAQPIAAAIAAASPPDAGPRKFSGRITDVCQAKGCWVMLEDEGYVARVMMKDHSVAVPKDTRGAAVVYGTLTVQTLDEKTAKHLAEDAGGTPPVAAREYRIKAVSVQMLGG